MATDFFLKIDGIEGESQDHKHKSEIDVISWGWGEQQTGTMSFGGGGGAGKVNMQDFHFTQRINKASPKLQLACSSGEHIKKAMFTARKAGKDQQEFYKVNFYDILVASYDVRGGQGDEVPHETISLNYTKVEVEYRPQKADGNLDGPITFKWDVKQNKTY